MVRDFFLLGQAQTFPHPKSNLLEILLLCLRFPYLEFTISLAISSHPNQGTITLVLADCNLAGWFLMGQLNDPLKMEVRFCLSSAANPAMDPHLTQWES